MSLLKKWTQSKDAAVASLKNQKTQGGIVDGSTTTDPMLTSSNRNYLVIIKQDLETKTVPGITSKSMVVVGQAPADFQMDQAVSWKSPWGAGLAGDGSMADIMAVTLGNRLVAQVATLQVWQGSGNDFTFTVTFELRAWSDPDADVMIPLQYLLAMSLPSLDEDGFLRSPGPTINTAKLGPAGAQALKGMVNTVTTIGKAAIDIGGQMISGDSKALSTFQQAGKDVKSAIGSIAKKNTLEAAMDNKISISIGSWFSMNNVLIDNVQHTIKAQMPDTYGSPQAASVTVTFRPMFSITTDDIASILKLGR